MTFAAAPSNLRWLATLRQRVEFGESLADERHVRRRFLPDGSAPRRIERPAMRSPGFQTAIPFAVCVCEVSANVLEALDLDADGLDDADRIATTVSDDAEGTNGRQRLSARVVEPQQ